GGSRVFSHPVITIQDFSAPGKEPGMGLRHGAAHGDGLGAVPAGTQVGRGAINADRSRIRWGVDPGPIDRDVQGRRRAKDRSGAVPLPGFRPAWRHARGARGGAPVARSSGRPALITAAKGGSVMKAKVMACMLAMVCLWLAGCASAPTLGLADTSGFDGRGATVLVEYALASEGQVAADKREATRRARVDEVHRLLAAQGFQPVSSGDASFQVRIVEGEAQEVTGEWTGSLGATVALITLGVVPAVFDYRAVFRYELWADRRQVHALDTPASWKEPVGLVS